MDFKKKAKILETALAPLKREPATINWYYLLMLEGTHYSELQSMTGEFVIYTIYKAVFDGDSVAEMRQTIQKAYAQLSHAADRIQNLKIGT